MILRPPRSTRTDTSFPTRRASDLLGGGRQPLGGDGEDDAPREEPGTERPGNEEDDGPEPADAAGAKAVNDAVAYIRAFPSRSEEHTSELQSLMRISYAVFCLKKKKTVEKHNTQNAYQTATK